MNSPAEGDTAAPESGLPDFTRARTSGGPLKPITMATIARAAGVSQGAISSLLNDRDYGIRVAEKTRERVFKVCREMGYIPNDLRAVVRMYPELGDTCLLISSKLPGGLANPFAARVAATLVGAGGAGTLAVARFDEGRDYQPDAAETPGPFRNATASKFICLGTANKSLCAMARRRGHPVAILGHESHIPGTTSFVPDYETAAKTTFGRLIKAGHKHIAILGGPFGSPDPRLAEISQALGHAAAELGLKIDAQNIFQGDLSFEAGNAALDPLLTRSPAPTAVFALSEAAGCGILTAALSRGLAVPGKLSVVALADHAGDPPSPVALTTVATPADELATAAAQELARQVREGIPDDALRIIIGVRLCERASIGPRK